MSSTWRVEARGYGSGLVEWTDHFEGSVAEARVEAKLLASEHRVNIRMVPVRGRAKRFVEAGYRGPSAEELDELHVVGGFCRAELHERCSGIACSCSCHAPHTDVAAEAEARSAELGFPVAPEPLADEPGFPATATGTADLLIPEEAPAGFVTLPVAMVLELVEAAEEALRCSWAGAGVHGRRERLEEALAAAAGAMPEEELGPDPAEELARGEQAEHEAYYGGEMDAAQGIIARRVDLGELPLSALDACSHDGGAVNTCSCWRCS